MKRIILMMLVIALGHFVYADAPANSSAEAGSQNQTTAQTNEEPAEATPDADGEEKPFQLPKWWWAAVAGALALMPLFSWLTVDEKSNKWIANTPTWDFGESWASMTTLVLTATSVALPETFMGLLAAETEPLAVLALIFALPAFFAPLVVKLGFTSLTKTEKDLYTVTEPPTGKVHVLWFVVASALTVFSLGLELMLLWRILEDLELATVLGGVGGVLTWFIPVLGIALALGYAFVTVRTTILEHQVLKDRESQNELFMLGMRGVTSFRAMSDPVEGTRVADEVETALVGLQKQSRIPSRQRRPSLL